MNRDEMTKKLFAGRKALDANPTLPDWYDEFQAKRLITSKDTYWEARCCPTKKWGTPGPLIGKELVDHCAEMGIPYLFIVYRFKCGRTLVYGCKVANLLKWKTEWIAKGGGRIGYYIPWGYWGRRKRKPLLITPLLPE